MKNYNRAKIFIITTAVLSCVIVLLTFALSYFKAPKYVRPNVLITEELIQNATSVEVEYKNESITFDKKEDVQKFAERFLETGLSKAAEEHEMPGKITFYTTHPDTDEATTVEIGFDEKLENIQLNGKIYTGADLLRLKNLLVTLSMGDFSPETTEETTEATTAETTEATTEEETTEKETAFYSTDSARLDWGGSAAYLAVANHCENYDDLIKDREENFPIVKITDEEELGGFVDSISEYFELETEEYNADFFAEKELYIIYIEENSSKNGYSVVDVSIDEENLKVQLDRIGEKEDGLASRFIFLSIEKAAVDECTVYTAYSEN